MATKQSLALLEKSVSLPGAGVTRTALLIDAKVTDKELGELGAALVAIDGSRSWWLGDYGLFLQNRKRAEILKADPTLDPAQVEAKGAHYIGEKAGVLGIDAGSWWNCVTVARFFKPSCRNEALTHGHHVVAIAGAGGAGGDARRALAWLDRAEKNKWSVSKMREQVNKSLATAKPPELSPIENPFELLDQADKWAHSAAFDTIDADGAKRLLSRWADLLAFIEKLKELAK